MSQPISNSYGNLPSDNPSICSVFKKDNSETSSKILRTISKNLRADSNDKKDEAFDPIMLSVKKKIIKTFIENEIAAYKESPNLSKFHHQICEYIAFTYFQNFKDFPLEMLSGFVKSKLEKNHLPLKLMPQLDLLFKEVVSLVFNEREKPRRIFCSSFITPQALLNEVLDTLNNDEKESLIKNLGLYFSERIQNLKSSLDSIFSGEPKLSDIAKFRESHRFFVKMLSKFLPLFPKDLPLRKEVDAFCQLLGKKLLGFFPSDEKKEIASPLLAEVSKALTYQKRKLPDDQGIIKDIEKIFFQKISNIPITLLESLPFGIKTRTILSCICEADFFLKKEEIDLLTFVCFFEKFFLKLSTISWKFFKGKEKDFVFDQTLKILKTMIWKVFLKLEDNMMKTKILDLSSPESKSLLSRLRLCLKQISVYLKESIEIKIKMQVEFDEILSTLYQLLSIESNKAESSFTDIRNWAENHSSFKMETFCKWLKIKVENKKAVSISGIEDLNLIYAQFISDIS